MAAVRSLQTLAERDPAARRARFDEIRRADAGPARARDFLLRSAMIAAVRRERAIP